MEYDWGATSITGRWRHQWDGAGACFLLVFLLGLVGAAVHVLVPNAGLGVSIPVFVGLAGLAAGSNDDDIGRLVEKIERVEAGEADVDFETDRDDDVGRLYEAIESLASTVQKRERELREERDRFTALFEYLPNPVAYGRHDEAIVEDVNQAFEETFGVEKTEIRGESVDDLIVPEDRREEGERINRRIAEEGSLSTEVRRQTPAGLRDFKLDAAVRDEGGDQFRGYSIWTDITERKRRERELQETNERLNAIVEASPDALVALDLDGNVELWNPAAERIFGWSEDEVLGEPLPIVPEDQTDEFAELREGIRSGETFSGIETKRARKDGELIDVNLSAAPLRGSDGEVVGSMGVLDDISERKAAERRSHEREVRLERYREYTDDVLDAIDDVFYVLDEDGIPQRWNDSLVEVTGYSDEEIESMQALEFFAEADRRLIAEAIEEVFETGDARVEAPFLTKDGEQIPHEFVASMLEDPDRNTVLAGVGRDVTERKRREQTLREREKQLERYKEYTEDVLDAIDDVFYIVDREGAIQRWNQSLVEVTGYSDEEIESMNARDFVVKEDRELIGAAIDNIEELVGEPLEARFRTKGGESIPFEFAAAPLTDPDGTAVLAGIARDISERKEKERQLSRLIDNVPGYVYRSAATPPWEVEFVSEGVRDITGYEPESLESGAVNWDEDVIAERHDELEAQIGTALDQREPFRLTYPIETADGEFRWVKEQGRGVYAADGSVEAMEGVVIDDTERKRYEQELERTKDLLEQAGRIARIGGWELDLTTDPPEMTWTDQLYEIHGLSPGTDIDVETAVGLYHPEDREYIRNRFEAAIEHGESYDMEVRLHSEADQKRWVRAMGEAVYDDGRVVKLRGSIQDITRQKEREQELRATKDRLQKFIETSPVGVVAVDPDGTVTLWNDGMEQIFGWSEEEVLGKPYPAAPDDVDRGPRSLQEQVLEGEPLSQIEVQRETKDGTRIDISVSAGPVLDESGEVTDVVAFIEDITERKERERELERTKELLAQAQHVARIGGWELDLTTDPSGLTFTDELYDIHGLAPGSEVSLEEALEFYHPEDRPRIRRAIEDAIEAGESYDVEARFHTANGEQLWVRAIGEPVQEDGTTVQVRGSLQDVTRQKERELALQSLHDATRGLLQTESETEVAELVVETAASLFDIPGVGVYVIDDASNRLVPVAYTDAFEALSDGAPAVAVGDDGVVWNCFATGERVVFDDADDARLSRAFGGDVDSGLLVPMGDHGVFVVATDGSRIDDETRRLAETLVATTEAAFDRLASEADLRKRDAELEAQNQRLRRQVQINDIIRRVDQSLIGATSREEVESAVCDRLVESEDVAFAWIGGFDADDDELVPRTWAGTGQTYLDALGLDQSTESAEPALATAGSGEPTVVSNVVDRLREDGWRRAALANGFHSVVSVPLAVDDYTHGVLTVYAEEPGVFDELERAVFAELGQSIANAINAVSAREALHADTVVELTLRFDDPTGVLARVARDADCEVEYEGISTRSADETRLFFATTGATAADVEAVLDDLYAVTAFRLVSESDDHNLFEATVTGPVLPSELVNQGASPRSIRATATGTEAVVDLPPSTNVREFVELLRESFPSVELGGRRNIERGMGTRQQLLSSLMDELTDRQLEVLRTAYFAGFFEWPRASTGEDVAEMLGVTQPTVNRHLRLGQQRLLAELFDEEAPELAA